MTKKRAKKESPYMNPKDDQPTTNSSTPATTGPSTSSNWSSRIHRLNTPQKLLLAAGLVMLVLVSTLAIYQAVHEEKPKAPAKAASVPQASVAITKDGFNPATISIKSGTQLTWTNQDSQAHQVAADPHPLNNSIEGFDSNTTLLASDSSSFIFEAKGTYTLHDHLNPLDQKFRMTVVVE